jgi:hypothetical protein
MENCTLSPDIEYSTPLTEILRRDDEKAEQFFRSLRKSVLFPMRISKYIGIKATVRIVGLTRDSQQVLDYSAPRRRFHILTLLKSRLSDHFRPVRP